MYAAALGPRPTAINHWPIWDSTKQQQMPGARFLKRRGLQSNLKHRNRQWFLNITVYLGLICFDTHALESFPVRPVPIGAIRETINIQHPPPTRANIVISSAALPGGSQIPFTRLEADILTMTDRVMQFLLTQVHRCFSTYLCQLHN